jgi:hypothetical protein
MEIVETFKTRFRPLAIVLVMVPENVVETLKC